MYSPMKKLASPGSPTFAPFDEVKTLLLSHVVPVNFRNTEGAKFRYLVRSSNIKFLQFTLNLPSKVNFGDQLQVQLRDRLVAGVNL